MGISEGLFQVPWDYFHLGLLLVVLMVFITGIVICVAVTGVCCFHWLDTQEEIKNRTDARNQHKSPVTIRDELVRLENARNAELRRQWRIDVPPTYEQLFPTAPTVTLSPKTTNCSPPHPVIHYV